jgi:hypothetical protein
VASRQDLFAKIIGDLEKFFSDQRCQVYDPVSRQPVTVGKTHWLIDKDEVGITKTVDASTGVALYEVVAAAVDARGRWHGLETAWVLVPATGEAWVRLWVPGVENPSLPMELNDFAQCRLSLHAAYRKAMKGNRMRTPWQPSRLSRILARRKRRAST